MVEQNHNIGHYQVVERLPREAEALVILQWIAYLVEPIMRQRGLRVNWLRELCYSERRTLLGQNAGYGEQIFLRLRKARDVEKFLDIAEILDTMLHELTHNVHGHHHSDFYRYYDDLRHEYKTLIRSGYARELYHPTTHTTGGGQLTQQQAQISDRPADAATQQWNDYEACASGTEYGRAIVEETNDGFWACNTCTLINAAIYHYCDACGARA